MQSLKYAGLMLLAVLASCLAAGNLNRTTTDRNVTLNDTFFLKREIRAGQLYHAIYIDSNKNSLNFNKLLGLDTQDSSNLANYLNALRKKKNLVGEV